MPLWNLLSWPEGWKSGGKVLIIHAKIWRMRLYITMFWSSFSEPLCFWTAQGMHEPLMTFDFLFIPISWHCILGLELFASLSHFMTAHLIFVAHHIYNSCHFTQLPFRAVIKSHDLCFQRLFVCVLLSFKFQRSEQAAIRRPQIKEINIIWVLLALLKQPFMHYFLLIESSVSVYNEYLNFYLPVSFFCNLMPTTVSRNLWFSWPFV